MNALVDEQYRRFYADEVRLASGISQPLLCEAFYRVTREAYLGPSPWRVLTQSGFRITEDAHDLYHNLVISLKPGQNLNNGQPSALASWIAALGIKPGDRLFHVGCGTGYYSAILAEMVGPTGRVIAAEVDPELAEQATRNLQHYLNVKVQFGDGAEIDPGLCDGILINAGVTHPHAPWLQRLKEGASIVLPLTAPMAPGLGKGVMVKITRRDDCFAAQTLSNVAIYSSSSVRDPRVETLLEQALESETFVRVKSVRIDPHEPSDTCILHSSTTCLSSETCLEE